jgi:hypothetical protein
VELEKVAKQVSVFRTGRICQLGIKFLESLTLFGFFHLQRDSCVV